MNWARSRIVPATLVLAAVLMTGSATGFVASANASEIKYVVNGAAVTSYDIQRRAAFLKLQRRKGNLNQMAADEMINQTLQAQELARLRIRVTDEQVDASYARFAQGNKLTPKQLDTILAQSGVTKAHFKGYIRAQMGWGQALSMRGRAGGAGGKMTEQEMVRKMLEKGGAKPKATEYMLQQVIFVVPAKDRGALLGKRKREAEAMRGRFNGCESTRQFAKGLVDVTVRDLGRVLEPALPPDWADSIKATKTGGATAVRETDRGVEFIGICRAKEVSDDRVAQLLFQKEGQEGNGDNDGLSKKYNEELRARAKIVQR
jgi:peptidyl-prolyl cis-trans isomerase SurA